ncbi:MAG: hypothetical protein HC828_04390 [Blastochloris sp.]|nr:hypothetical protein [Blastochloris sp.]
MTISLYADAPDRRKATSATPTTQPFVRVPVTLLPTDARVRGIWALVARLFILERGPVPLSAADLGAYDPSLSYGAASRLLGRMVRDGWLIPQTRRGQKTGYTPSWGAGRPMIVTAAHHHKPRRLATVPLPAQILDVFLGKLTPRRNAPATIARYTSVPLLTLADVGIYVQALTGVSATTDALEQYNLVRHKTVCQLPTLPTTLARVTQQTLEQKATIYLTQAGAQLLGLPRPTPQPPRPAAGPQPLFFVERHLIGGLIDHLIATKGNNDTSPGFSRSKQRSGNELPKTITWNAWSHESINHESRPQHESHGSEGAYKPAMTQEDPQRPMPPPHHAKNTFRLQLDIIHEQLNPGRQILPGEWLELSALHDEHGADLLVWQARAQRAGRTHVTPAYYHACAAQTALATYRPPRTPTSARRSPANTTPDADPPPPIAPGTATSERMSPPYTTTASEADVRPVPVSTACQSRVTQLGQAAGESVRCPQLLATVPPDLLSAWTRVVGHPGLRARFADPLGFAIRQMQQGQFPPPQARLSSWAQQNGPLATPWTVADVTRLNEHYGDLFRLGSGQATPVHDDATVPASPAGGDALAGPWTPTEVARVQQDYGDLFQVGCGVGAAVPPHRRGASVGGSPAHRDVTAAPPETWADGGAAAVRESALPRDSAQSRVVLAALRLRAGRGPLRTLLDQVRVVVQDRVVQVLCRDGAQVTQVHTHLVPVLPTVLTECGVRARVVVRVRC